MDEKQVREFYNSINKHLTFLNDVDLNADGDATVKLITKTINQYSNSPFIKFCVEVINSISKNEYEFCRKLFEISCALVKYRRDPEGHEIVMTPLLFIRVGEGDCKKFTTWICAVLKCRGIKSASKVVNYDSAHAWQHIYAIAWPRGYDGMLVLDPVNNELFNVEVKHRMGRINYYDGTYSELTMAKLSIMGNTPDNKTFFGLGAADEILGDLEDISGRGRYSVTQRCIQGIEDDYINGLEYDSIEAAPDDDSTIAAKKNPAKAQKKAAKKQERQAKKPQRVEKKKKLIKKGKSLGFAPVRNAFLGLILLGGALEKTNVKINLAKKLAELWQKDNGASIKALWAKFGGKPDAIKKAIIKASHIQISGPEEYFGIGAVSLATTAALIAAASPLLIASIKLLHAKKVMQNEQAMRTIDATDIATDQATDNNGNLKDLNTIVKQGSKIIDEVIKLDEGGDKGNQQNIKTFSTSNDPTPQQYNTADPNAPAAQGDGGTAKGFQLTNASSWLTGSFLIPMLIIANQNQHPGWFSDLLVDLSPYISTFMLCGSLFLFSKPFFKKIIS